MIITNISSTNDPILLYFKSLKNNKLSENQFIADSEKVVLKLLRSKFKTKVILGTDDFIKKMKQSSVKLTQNYTLPLKKSWNILLDIGFITALWPLERGKHFCL